MDTGPRQSSLATFRQFSVRHMGLSQIQNTLCSEEIFDFIQLVKNKTVHCCTGWLRQHTRTVLPEGSLMAGGHAGWDKINKTRGKLIKIIFLNYYNQSLCVWVKGSCGLLSKIDNLFIKSHASDLKQCPHSKGISSSSCLKLCRQHLWKSLPFTKMLQWQLRLLESPSPIADAVCSFSKLYLQSWVMK